jgi:uncharacterized protein YfaS (alpha-2-macroglobulin family)
VRWTNEEHVRSEVASAVARSLRRSTGLAILVCGAGLFFGGILVGARASRQGRKLVAAGAFAAPTLVLLAVVSLTVTQMQSSHAPGLQLEGELDDGDLTFGKYIEYGDGDLTSGIAGLGDRVMDAVERAAEEAKSDTAVGAAWPATAMAPGAPGGKPGAWAGSELGPGTAADESADEMVALEEGRERVAQLENLRKLGYVGGDDHPGLLWVEDATEEGKKKRAARLVREYAHRAAEWRGVRDDFAEVLAWSPLLVTDAKGEATFEFDTSDSITSFRVLVDAHDGRGALGSGDAEFSNRVPFFAEPKFPLALTAGDEVDLPVVVGNDSGAALDVRARVRPDGVLLGLRDATGDARISVDAGARGRAIVPLVALGGRGAASLDVEVSGGAGFLDRSRRTIDVHPRGYPVAVRRSGTLEKTDASTFQLPDRLSRASLRGGLRIYPSTLSTLVDGLDAMLQEPHGCFEQVSSTNYPNVLVLNYLEEQRAAPPAVAARARDLLAKGYAMLTGYECRNRGFEWFGKDPAHEGLTAYGVLEFADMARVFDVDRTLVERSRDWLLGRRDGNGGYKRLENGYDGFARAPQNVHDAYVTWALSEADAATDLAADLALLERRVDEGADPYVVALAANAFRNRGHAAAKRALDRLAAMQRADGGFDAKGTSITSSVGKNLEMETTALAALAFARSPDRLANSEAAVRFLLANRDGGRFGATQATILALRALTEHAKASRRTATDHEITVLVNGSEVAGRSIRAGAPGVVEFGAEVVDALVPGENRIEVRTTGAEALPWAFTLDFTTDLPANDPECAIGIETSLASSDVREGASVEARVEVTNRTDAPQAMTIARVGVPAGLEPRAERLEELKKAGAIDFFELRPREVVLYWTALRPKAEKRVAFDLTAAIPGRFEGPASSAYLYYGDDRKTWSAPLRATVR